VIGSEYLDKVVQLVTSLGVTKGLFVAFFVWAHTAVWMLYRGRLKDRQGEINRLAEENRDYRERFIVLLDKQFKIPKRSVTAPPTAQAKRLPGKGRR
jgi:hypothetical protein